jgi:Uma2 family endonuclease
MESPASFRHEQLQSFLAVLVGTYVAEKELGDVYGAHAAYKLDEHNVVEPDLSFVSHARRSIVKVHYADGPPDLAVEITSQGTRRIDEQQKRPAYERAATPELWIIDHLREEAQFLVYTGGRFEPARLERKRYFDSRVLPGFRVDVRWFWSDPLPKPSAILRKLLK